MRILIAPDKFKGSLDALAVAETLREGFRRVFPEAAFELCPIADGGEGTAAAFQTALGGEWRQVPSVDAREHSIRAEYLWLADRRLAVIDMSAASGLAQLTSADRDPWLASTRGTGLLVADAIRGGAKSIFVGLGGSATNDAGCGLAHALGWRFLDDQNRELPPHPAALKALARIEPPAELFAGEVVGISDVTNPLLGERGCSAIFAPQKGARAEDIAELDATLARVADVVEGMGSGSFREVAGAGAAGGLGFGLLAFAGARLEPGFDVIAELFDLPGHVDRADLVLTAEGKLDAQTLDGKGPLGLARLARAAGKPIFAFAGMLEDEARLYSQFDALIPLANRPMSLADSLADSRELLALAAERAARLYQAGRRAAKAGDCNPGGFSG